jgi:methylthioribose-1-phosphate isomerase
MTAQLAGSEPIRPVCFDRAAGRLLLLDQRLLPAEEAYLSLAQWPEASQAIRDLVVRGAPAIGLAAAYAMVLAGLEADRLGLDRQRWLARLEAAGRELVLARPTAVNLAWAVHRMLAVAHAGGDTGALLAEAEAVHLEDLAANTLMGGHGGGLLPAGARVLTHCNAGALATSGYGTALGVLRWAHAAGRLTMVYATETRPVNQGARLTTWELQRDGIPVTLIPDSAAAWLMRRGEIDAVVVGADRVAANGDTANKIGTYGLAIAAARHGLPFYVAAGRSTLDGNTPDGDAIVIEERDPSEVTQLGGRRVVPAGITARNPAFDVTPAELITAIITEVGVLRPPYGPAIRAAIDRPAPRGETAGQPGEPDKESHTSERRSPTC